MATDGRNAPVMADLDRWSKQAGRRRQGENLGVIGPYRPARMNPVLQTAFVRSLSAVGIAAFLAGCAGVGSTGLSSAPPVLQDGATAVRRAKGTARFVIRIPKKKKRGAHYISAATVSMKLEVLQGAKSIVNETVDLTPSSGGCSSAHSTTTCTVDLRLSPGSYTASVTMYDALGGTGNALSTGQDVQFTVAAGQANPVSMTLSGVPAKIVVLDAGTDEIDVLAQDADGNYIFGPGAPAFTAAMTGGTAVVAIAQPTAAHPNRISFSAAGSAVGNETIGITAGYPSGQTNACTEAGAVCSLPSAVTASYGQTLFVGNYGGGNVTAFGVPLTSNTQSPVVTLPASSVYPMVLDPSDDLLAVGYSPGAIYEAEPPYSTSVATSATSIDTPYWAALDSKNDIFIANSGNSTVTEYAPPYNGAPNTTISTDVDEPYDLALDGSNNLYVGNEGNHTLSVYPANSYTTATPVVVTLASPPTSMLISGSLLYVGETSHIEIFSLATPLTNASTPKYTLASGIDEVYCMTLDSKDDLWASNVNGGANSEGSILEFPAPITDGESPSVTISQTKASGSPYEPYGIVFDSTGNLYVVDVEGGTSQGALLMFSPPITSASTPKYAIETSVFYLPYFAAITGQKHLVISP